MAPRTMGLRLRQSVWFGFMALLAEADDGGGIAPGIVERYGGRIEPRNRRGRGAESPVRMPAADPGGAAAKEEA